MSEDSSRSNLKSEWTLLIQSFIDDEEIDLKNKRVQGLSIDFIHEQIKDLSKQKKVLFHKIESIKKEIDEAHVIIENLVLVGSDTDDIQQNIDDLNKNGETISQEIMTLEKKLKKIRTLQGLI